MTLLEQFDAARYLEDLPDSTAIRRALAIAQAVDELDGAEDDGGKMRFPCFLVYKRADELLGGEK